MRLLVDTDLGNDIDDVLALSMIFHMHRGGNIHLDGVMSSKKDSRSAPFASFLAEYFGVKVAISKVSEFNGIITEKANYLHLMNFFKERYPDCFDAERRIMSSESLMRNILESASDKSVTLMMIGFSTNISNFLSDEGNLALFNSKVSSIYIMAGRFDGKGAEYNVMMDVSSFRSVLLNYSGKMIFFSGELGRKVRFSHDPFTTLHANGEMYPIVMSYYAFRPHYYARESWDLLAALYCDEASRGLFSLSKPGCVQVNNDGVTKFEQVDRGNHFIADIPDYNLDEVRRRVRYFMVGNNTIKA